MAIVVTAEQIRVSASNEFAPPVWESELLVAVQLSVGDEKSCPLHRACTITERLPSSDAMHHEVSLHSDLQH